MTLTINLATRSMLRWTGLLPILFLLIPLIVGCTGNLDEYDDIVLDGVASLNLGKPERALEEFDRAISMDPNRAEGYVGRGNALNTLGQYEAAVADYDRAIAIDPTLANAFVNRGIAHSHLGNLKLAVADYEKGLALDPKIDDPPGIMKRLFDNVPNREKGIRKHLEVLKKHLKEGADQAADTDTANNDA